jgi:NitT/TauT family transport system ATP-binding protein
MKLEVRAVSKVYLGGRGPTPAVQDLTFAIAPGEFVCLLGPSGCGKTTTLNLIAGLDQPDDGEILADSIRVTGPGRDRGVIFQEAALFPWLNVWQNVAFGLAARGVPRVDRQRIALEHLRLVHLEPFGKANVHELSGGMKQRVAIARALSLDPKMLLMDEPFGALDALAREQLHLELQTLWAQTGKTILFVTHNVREALVLGDRVLLFSARPGRIRGEFRCDLPRPRHIDDHALIDLSRGIMQDLREEVLRTREE